MPISQQTITGSVKTPANTDAAITGVTFKLSKSDFEAGEIIAVNTVAATVDTASGDFTVTLWPNDAGMDGTSTYARTFNFSDGSAVTGLASIRVLASSGPKTIEDVAFETLAAGAVRPFALQIMTQAAYDALTPKIASTVYLIRG